MTNVRLKRLAYQSWHRGTQENDLLLGRFADAHLMEMTEDDLDQYEWVLDQKDSDIFAWVTGQAELPEDFPILKKIREYNRA